MYSGSFSCWFAVLSASLLLFSGIGVESALSVFRWRFLSQSSNRYVVMHETGEVDADGDNTAAADVYLDFVSLKENLVKVVSAQNHALFLGINLQTGLLQAGAENASVVNVFRLIQKELYYQFWANVTIPCSSESEEGSGIHNDTPEPCDIVKECALAFHGNGQPVRCQDQEDDQNDASKSFYIAVVL